MSERRQHVAGVRDLEYATARPDLDSATVDRHCQLPVL